MSRWLYPSGTWRESARKVINEGLKDLSPYAAEKEIKDHLRPLYPFGGRGGWPYKMWLSEVKTAVKSQKQAQLIFESRKENEAVDVFVDAVIERGGKYSLMEFFKWFEPRLPSSYAIAYFRAEMKKRGIERGGTNV